MNLDLFKACGSHFSFGWILMNYICSIYLLLLHVSGLFLNDNKYLLQNFRLSTG